MIGCWSPRAGDRWGRQGGRWGRCQGGWLGNDRRGRRSGDRAGDADDRLGTTALATLGPLPPLLARVLAELRHDLRPRLLPPITADNRPQRHQRVHVLPHPVHPGALEPGLDHQFVGTLHRTAADRVPLRLELGVANLLLALLQIRETGGNDLQRRTSLVPALDEVIALAAEFVQDRLRIPVLQLMQLLPQPLTDGWG